MGIVRTMKRVLTNEEGQYWPSFLFVRSICSNELLLQNTEIRYMKDRILVL